MFGRQFFLFALILAAFTAAPAIPATAQETAATAGNPSGLPLPRFVTTRSQPINVRVGPGTKYDVAWVYLKAGVPVEIVKEFDTWRKIRDIDGAEGWVHQSMLIGRRAGIVAPWSSDPKIPLLTGRSAEGGVRAYLPPGFKVDISECDGLWCEVSATDHPTGGRTATYQGFISQGELWGVYQGENFD